MVVSKIKVETALMFLPPEFLRGEFYLPRKFLMQGYMPLLLFSYERPTEGLSPTTLEILNLVEQNF